MWLQLIFTHSFIFYCAPLVFCTALYHWSKKGWVDGVASHWNRWGRRSTSAGSSSRWKSLHENQTQTNPIVQSSLKPFSSSFTYQASQRRRPPPLQRCLRDAQHLCMMQIKKMRTHRPLTASLSLPVTSSKLAPWIKLLDLSGEREAVVRDKLGAQLRQNCTKQEGKTNYCGL